MRGSGNPGAVPESRRTPLFSYPRPVHFFPGRDEIRICENDLPTANLETPWGERDRYLVPLE